MFWGCALKPGASHTLKEGSEILHISQVCLADGNGKSLVQVNDTNSTYTIACLDEKNTMVSLDLFFNTMAPPTFVNKGKSEVHLTGYFEMTNDAESDMGSDEEEEEEISESESEEVPVKNAADAKKAIAALSKKMAAVESESEEGEEDSEEDEEDFEEGDDEDDEEDDEEDSEGDEDMEEDDDEEESEAEEEAPKANNKRPAAAVSKQAPPQKVQKADDSASTDSFAKQVAEFVKKNGGKQTVSAIGGKCQKPANVPGKLKAFLAARKEFKITGDMVALA